MEFLNMHADADVYGKAGTVTREDLEMREGLN